jgi:hypothetical protein
MVAVGAVGAGNTKLFSTHQWTFQMEDFNSWASGIQSALETWGALDIAPQGGKPPKFHVSDRKVLTSFAAFSPGVALPSKIEFFKSADPVVASLSTTTFPLQNVALSVLGVRISHCLKFTITDPAVANEQQQVFEQTAKLTTRYRNRSDIFSAYVADLVQYNSVLDGSRVTVGDRVPTWLMLQNPIKYGASQNFDWDLSIPTGFTLESVANNSTPTIPNQVGQKYWIALSLLVREMTSL